MRSILPKDILQGVDNYAYSGDVPHLALQAQGFTELVARPAPDLDVFWDLLLRMAADLPLTEGGEEIAQVQVPDITRAMLMAQHQTGSAASLLPLVMFFGSHSESEKHAG